MGEKTAAPRVIKAGVKAFGNEAFVDYVLSGVRPGEKLVVLGSRGSDPSLMASKAEAAGKKFVECGFAAILSGLDAFDADVIFCATELPDTRHPAEYAASLAAVANHASSLEIYHETSFIRTADRDRVPSAKVIERLDFAEATELSYFGAPVIHPASIQSAVSAGIPVRLKCALEPEKDGTLITQEPSDDDDLPVKGFSVIHNVALINVEGAGMRGVPGTAQRLFGAFGREKISVLLISQGSSEYSICVAVPEEVSGRAVTVARAEFASEMARRSIHSIEAVGGYAVIAAVGERMSGLPGIAASFFNSLARTHVNVKAIAQGSSERNISAVIEDRETTKALCSLHAGFFLSRAAISLGIFGKGNIGGTFLDQVAKESEKLLERGIDIRVRAIAGSKKMLLSEEGVDLFRWRELFERDAVNLDVDRMVDFIAANDYPHSLIVDCTSSEDIPKKYVEWLSRGIHIVTPNKKAGTSPMPYYREMFEACRRTGSRFLYETTVGAGLPVICTLQDLQRTGDTVRSVEGMVSGTLAWLFSAYDGTVPFSELVLKAKSMGYTEPDPRDDLSGMDVARKTVIMAREIGREIEVKDIKVTSLVPQELVSVPRDEFLSRISEADEDILKMYRAAREKGECLRYVGSVGADGKCTVSLAGYPESHPFSQARGTDNVICFTTDRYLEQPLVVKGPGAGPEVTAGGVFADVLRLCGYLGARL